MSVDKFVNTLPLLLGKPELVPCCRGCIKIVLLPIDGRAGDSAKSETGTKDIVGLKITCRIVLLSKAVFHGLTGR